MPCSRGIVPQSLPNANTAEPHPTPPKTWYHYPRNGNGMPYSSTAHSELRVHRQITCPQNYFPSLLLSVPPSDKTCGLWERPSESPAAQTVVVGRWWLVIPWVYTFIVADLEQLIRQFCCGMTSLVLAMTSRRAPRPFQAQAARHWCSVQHEGGHQGGARGGKVHAVAPAAGASLRGKGTAVDIYSQKGSSHSTTPSVQVPFSL